MQCTVTYVDWLGPALLDGSADVPSSAIRDQQNALLRRLHLPLTKKESLLSSTRADAHSERCPDT